MPIKGQDINTGYSQAMAAYIPIQKAVILGQFGVYGSFSYSPKRNLIQQHDTHQGVIWNRFGKIEEGRILLFGSFRQDIRIIPIPSPIPAR